MGKTVSATDLLGRRSPRTTPKAPDHSAETTSPLVAEQPDDWATSALVAQSPTYQRATVFLTPDQRRWLKDTARALPDGLSGSDVVRLALNRLRDDLDGGMSLDEALTAQAHLEVATLTGRKNRGLPTRGGGGEAQGQRARGSRSRLR